MKVAVLGSGGGALAVAADLARGGRDAVLADLPSFMENLDAVRERGGVEISTGWYGLEHQAVGVADSIADAVRGAALVIVVVPCFGHEPFMEVLTPLLEAGQSLLFFGEGSGSIVARGSLAAAGKDGVVVGESNTLPYLARPVRPGVVTADRKIGGVLVAATPASDTEALLGLVADVWPYIEAAESVWDAVLINFNAIDHVAAMLANVGTLENRSGGMLLWGEGGTPSVVRAIEAVDAELLAIRRALGLSDRRRYRDFLIAQGFAPDAGPALYDVVRASKLVVSYCPTGPDALQSRYLTEDIPYALVLASSIGVATGVPTPVIDGLIAIGGAMLARDFRAEGRTLDTLGLGGAGVEQLRRYAETGRFAGLTAMPDAPVVERIANVTAFVGDGFEPRIVDIDLREGSIAAIGEPGATPAGRGAVSIDGTRLLAFPGMVDAHDHLRNLAPGLTLAEGMSLDAWLRVWWAHGAEMGVDEYRVGALLGCVQRLKTGITTVVDHCYTFHAPGLDEASIEGYEASGVRWMYARGIMTRPYEPVCETWGSAESKIRALVEGGVVAPDRLFVAPVSIRQALPEEFRKARALADDLGVGVYAHVAETASELELWRQETGDTPIRALDALGFLTDRTVLVHCVLLDDDEIGLLARRGAHVVHCPTNHLKLAKGFTRVPDLLAAGVNVAMGVDMMADMLIEMRTEIGMHAAHRLDPAAVSHLDAFRMATRNGGRAVGWGGRIGLLEAGHLADITLLDARSLLQAPLVDPAHALLYATDPGMVRHVLVGGRWVVRDGRSTLVDEDALLEEAEDVARAYLGRIGAPAGPWFAR